MIKNMCKTHCTKIKACKGFSLQTNSSVQQIVKHCTHDENLEDISVSQCVGSCKSVCCCSKWGTVVKYTEKLFDKRWVPPPQIYLSSHSWFLWLPENVNQFNNRFIWNASFPQVLGSKIRMDRHYRSKRIACAAALLILTDLVILLLNFMI